MVKTDRLNRIDEIRGITLVSMVLYHFCWDLKFMAGFSMEWFTDFIGRFWQRSICITFILISGFCFSLGRRRFKRSMTVFVCGLIITIVTLVFLPANRIIFGVLTFIGTAGLLTIPVDKLLDKKIKKKGITVYIIFLALSFVLFLLFYTVNKHYLNLIFTSIALPESLFHGYVSTFIGFTDRTFFSTDYFAMLPWYFMYMCGYFLHKVYAGYRDSHSIGQTDGITSFLAVSKVKPLSFIGRHTLIIYMLHQPVLYAVTMLINLVSGK